MFKAKLKAALIHTSITLVVAVITASLVYGVWYPGAFAQMMSGTDLYLLIVMVELCLGPLMSLVIYSPDKPRTELVRDYSIVCVVQLAALIYGLYSVALSRPVYLVFVKDRIEVVASAELKTEDVNKSKNSAYRSFSWLGPRSICTEGPADPKEKSDLLLSALAGKDIQLLPKYYRECHEKEVINRSFAKQVLFASGAIKINDLPSELQSTDFKWLPVMTRFGNGIAVYENSSTESPTYLNLDPYSAPK